MSKTYSQKGSDVYDHVFQKSEAFRQDLSHVLVSVIIPRVTQTLQDRGELHDAFKSGKYASSTAHTLMGDMYEKFDRELPTVSSNIFSTNDGVDIVAGSHQSEADLLDQFTEKVSGSSPLSQVIQERDSQIAIYMTLAPLSMDVERFFGRKTHHLDIYMQKTNYKDVFPSMQSLFEDITTDANMQEAESLPLVELKKRNERFLDSIYNKVIYEWLSRMRLGDICIHSLHLLDEPTFQKGVKGKQIDTLHFEPIHMLLLHFVVTYLSHGTFGKITEQNISRTQEDLQDIRDLDTYASVIVDEIKVRIQPLMTQISGKKPFGEWLFRKINKDTILHILRVVKNASKNRSDRDMSNPYWLAKIDPIIRLSKVTILE